MPILPWLIPAIASVAGSIFTNRSNRGIARDQMTFQERMSNTSAQRSAEDYRRAGLNPGLAYERGASTPGGASATMGDALGSGVNSAQSARALKQSMDIARHQSEADFALKREQAGAARAANIHGTAQAALADIQTREMKRQNDFNFKMQPHMRLQMIAQSLKDQYEVPGQKNTADFETKLGERTGLGINSAKLVMEIMKAMRPLP